MSDEGLIPNRQAIQQDAQRQWHLPAPPSPVLDTIGSSFRQARADLPTHSIQERISAYSQIAQALQERGFPQTRYWNKYIVGEKDPPMIKLVQQDVDGLRATAAAAGKPDPFPTLPKSWAEYDQHLLSGMREQQDRDARVVAHGKTLPWLIGSLGGGLTDPATAWGMLFGGGEARLAVQIGREALAQGALEAAEQVPINRERERQGRPALTTQESLTNVGTAMALGAALPGAVHGVAAAARMAHDALPPGLLMGRALNGAELPPVTGGDLAQAFEQAVPEHLRTPDQVDALRVVRRDAEMAGSSPFTHDAGGDDAHVGAMDRALGALGGIPQSRPRAAAPMGVDAYLAAVKRSESGGNPNARNPMPGQTASGLYGFTNGTWLGAYRAEFPNSGLDNAAILARKGDAALQERLMRRLTEDNAKRLRAIGAEVDPGNLYVMHHLGTGDGPRVLRADPETRLSALLSDKVIDANPYMRDMTVGDFLAWTRRKMGQDAGAIDGPAARFDDDGAMAALEAERVGIENERAAANAALADQGKAMDPAAFAPEMPRIDPGRVDRAAGIEAGDAIPQLRRDLFRDETSWRIAQSKVDAEYMGQAEPRMTRESVWDDARTELAAARQGTVYGALYHEEAGPIDVMWGDETHGLAHIMAKHPDVVADLARLIEQMEVVPERSIRNRLHLESPDHVAKVRLDWDEQRQNWLLTAFKKDREAPAAAEDGGAAGVARDHSPTREAGTDISGSAAPGNGPGAPSPVAAASERMADPGGPDMKLEADRIWHDLNNAMEEDTRAFGLADGDERSIAQVKEDFSSEAMALQALRTCL